MSQAWQTDCKTHTQKLVLLALADNANDEGYCWPSITRLAGKCDLSRKGVMSCIQQLDLLGFIQIERTDGKQNHYWVLTDRKLVTRGDQSLPVTSHPGLPVLVTPMHPSASTIYTLNHHKNRKRGKKLADAPPSSQDSESQKPDPEAATPSPSAHQIFIDLWCQAYESKFGGKYSFGGRDAAAVKALLVIEAPEKLIRIAKAAWEKSGKGYWNCENQSASLITFHAKLNQIRAELNAKHENHQNPRNLGVGITPQEQTRQLLAKQQQLEAKRRAEHANNQPSKNQVAAKVAGSGQLPSPNSGNG